MPYLPISSLQTRRRVPELMDDPALSPRFHRQALRGLARINAVTRIDRVLWQAMWPVLQSASPAPVRILDLACGGGDVLSRIATRARRAHVHASWHACDISATALDAAREKWSRHLTTPLHTFEHDATSGDLPEPYDIIFCSLFLHHLSDADALLVLKAMRRCARQLVLVDDLLRSRLGYVTAWVGCRLLSRSAIVHTDGPLSVQAGWTLDEIRRLADTADMETATLSKHWPQRFLLRWRRDCDGQ